jgi:hypothetical protein
MTRRLLGMFLAAAAVCALNAHAYAGPSSPPYGACIVAITITNGPTTSYGTTGAYVVVVMPADNPTRPRAIMVPGGTFSFFIPSGSYPMPPAVLSPAQASAAATQFAQQYASQWGCLGPNYGI